MDAQSGCYTLLADDNSRFSNDPSLIRTFKAHLLYNLVLNGRIAFSDNQVICSANLQKLAATDPTLIALIENGLFDVAVRFVPEQGGVLSLRSVHRAFIDENKIRHAALDYDSSPLALFERHATKVPWTYDVIRNNYTSGAEQLLVREFRQVLTDTEFDRFLAILSEEKDRDSGLGREFLQNRLHLRMRKAGIAVGKSRRELIRRCTDAPYLSNLPATIGLNPIYAHEHSASFDLMRGGGAELETTGAVRAPSRFDHSHYVEGLCRLTLDDVQFLQELPSRRAYLERSAGLAGESDYDQAVAAFVEFNLLLEDRIASRFPEIARRSSGAPDRTFYKQKALAYAGAGAEDLFGILVGHFCPVAPLALCKQVLLDVLPERFRPKPRSVPADTVRREVTRRRLAEHLRDAGQAERLDVEERTIGGRPFSKEIVIS